jgi:hypothetical protein
MYKNASRFRQHRSDIGRPIGHGLGRYASPDHQRRAALKRQAATASARVTKPKRALTKPKPPKPPRQGLRISYSNLLLIRECLNEAVRQETDPKRQERLARVIAQINREIDEQRR